jgi:transcriptional regulator GlxA family with amidase domain
MESDFSDYETLPEARVLRRLTSLLMEELKFESSGVSPIVTAEVEQAVLVAFLCGNRHNHSHLLAPRRSEAAPWQLRWVKEYIESYWDQPTTIEALAIVGGTSARSIFHSFKQHRGYSPMRFVKQIRLRQVREILIKPATGTTVTNTAFACGVGNLGHFYGDYLRVFGEAPSATLNRRNAPQ